MTDNEIKKALKEHIERTETIKYGVKKTTYVNAELLKDTLDLINRLQAEIENQSQNFKVLVSDHRCLQQSFDNLKGLYQAEKEKVESAKSKSIYFAKELQKARAEIERLEERIIEVQLCDKELIETLHKVHEEKIETAKAEAIKEFVARLIIVNETTAKYCEANEKVVRVTDIEDLVKEMEGEAE